MSENWTCPVDRFPILNSARRYGDRGYTFPIALVHAHEAQALKNHGQSVDRLKARGGLAWAELSAVLWDRKYRSMDLDDALRSCVAALLKWEQRPK